MNYRYKPIIAESLVRVLDSELREGGSLRWEEFVKQVGFKRTMKEWLSYALLFTRQYKLVLSKGLSSDDGKVTAGLREINVYHS